MNGVQSAVAELNEQTVGMDMEQKIKRIHDYICQRLLTGTIILCGCILPPRCFWMQILHLSARAMRNP